MKTIEQAAKIEAKLKHGFDMEEEKYYQSNKVNVYDAFKKGVKFAQRWILVEKELPELRDKPYQVLVKSSTGHMETYHIIDKKSQHFIKEFISWRPITFL